MKYQRQRYFCLFCLDLTFFCFLWLTQYALRCKSSSFTVPLALFHWCCCHDPLLFHWGSFGVVIRLRIFLFYSLQIQSSTATINPSTFSFTMYKVCPLSFQYFIKMFQVPFITAWFCFFVNEHDISLNTFYSKHTKYTGSYGSEHKRDYDIGSVTL